MASLREYRKKIKSVKSTQQITKAMKMVSAARLRKAQSNILSARPFALKMRDLIRDLAGRIQQTQGAFAPSHPLLRSHQSSKLAVVLVTADKGLCGSFNTFLIRRANEVLREHADKEVKFFVIGRRGRDFFKRLDYPFVQEYVGIFNQLSYKHAEIIGQELMDLFIKEELSQVLVIYNEFKSVLQQNLVVEKLLPIAPLESSLAAIKSDYIYEPAKPELLAALLPRYLKSQIFRILLESAAAELGARMAAMDSATKNAAELINSLTLKLNRTRQAIITREIAELVSGAEALK